MKYFWMINESIVHSVQFSHVLLYANTVNCLFFVIEKVSLLRLLTKIFHPEIFRILNFSSPKYFKMKY